jgi:ankyrin repeat protein
MRMLARRWSGVLLVAVILCAASAREAAGSAVPLIEAVKSGDERAVREFLQQKVDVNVADDNGTTALHWAVHRDNLPLVDALLRAGANVTARNDYGVTPLFLACEKGSAASVERLLLASADANAVLPGGETVLMTAARAGNVEVIRLLLAKGANVNARTALREQTALMWAAAEGNVGAIQALIGAGANVSARSKEPIRKGELYDGGGRRLHYNGDMMEAFTPLLFATRAGHLDAVEALLDGGAKIDDPTSDGTTALLVAVINAHWDLAAYLLDRGANPNAMFNGATALHLLAEGRTIHYGFQSGQPPAPVATGTLSSLDVAKLLIAHGAEVDARSRRGSTALMDATSPADLDLMRLLVAGGADPHLKAGDGSTLLMRAAGRARLQDNEDAYEVIKFVWELGVTDVNATNRAGDTALHNAARRDYLPIVQFLVDHGAKLDIKNKQGRLPVEIAQAEIQGVVVHHSPEAEALLTRLMHERRIPLPQRLTDEEFYERFVQRGPTVTCPAAPPATVVPVGTGRARVTFGEPTAMRVSPAESAEVANVSCSPASGSEFPLGATIVTCTARDRVGRADSCRFDLHVVSAGGTSDQPPR